MNIILIYSNNRNIFVKMTLEIASYIIVIRKTVTNPEEMIQTDWHHTIYELEGDISDLSNIKNSDLLDKKVIKRKTEAALILDTEMSIEEELVEYLSYILELEDNKIKKIVGVFNDKAKEADVE